MIHDEALKAAEEYLDGAIDYIGSDEDIRCVMKEALEAAAPYIRAQALEDAAEGWWLRDDVPVRFGVWSWLRARAASEMGGE